MRISNVQMRIAPSPYFKGQCRLGKNDMQQNMMLGYIKDSIPNEQTQEKLVRGLGGIIKKVRQVDSPLKSIIDLSIIQGPLPGAKYLKIKYFTKKPDEAHALDVLAKNRHSWIDCTIKVQDQYNQHASDEQQNKNIDDSLELLERLALEQEAACCTSTDCNVLQSDKRVRELKAILNSCSSNQQQ